MIICGDCLDIMPTLGSDSIDMVLSDVPYGQTRNAWDKPIPFAPMWEQLYRLAKPAAAIVLMAAQPFAAQLICSNLRDFRYDLVWSKNKATGFLNAKKQPLRSHEHILVFYRRVPVYNPQMTSGHKPASYWRRTKDSTNYGAQESTRYDGTDERYPTSVLPISIINNDDPDKAHPTQKPVDLMLWLIKTYTNSGAKVLDFAAGSGTTAVAALRSDRAFVCIEKYANYAQMIAARTAAERSAGPLFEEPTWPSE